ncbi:hypothetical protein FRC17_006193 [Serendipita sp. 399]|nr:hypothetical protein FRC17_006193 [Serendipita sp. 399]
MKDIDRLDAFIKGDAHKGANSDSNELPFDLDTVIRVCRQAGYFDHAVYLARKYERHDDYLRIQIEDAGKYRDALEYLRKLGPAAIGEQSESNLTRYGRVLLEKLPEQTTQLFIDICTGNGFVSSTHEEKEDLDATKVPASAGAAGSGGGPSYLSYLAYNRNSAAISSSGDAASTTPSAQKEAGGSGRQGGVPSMVFDPSHKKRASTTGVSVYSGSRGPSPPPAQAKSVQRPLPFVPKPSPRAYFVHFVDHPKHFIRFLEEVALSRWGQKIDVKGGASEKKKAVEVQDTEELPFTDADADKHDRSAVWNTLLELYLTLSNSPPETDKDKGSEVAKGMKTKALHLLTSSFEFDPTHALLVCSTQQFTEGLILLWEKLRMYEDILRFWMDKEKSLGVTGEVIKGEYPSSEVLRYLNRYGESNPHLYPLVMRFLTSTPELLKRHENELTAILEHIEEAKIMPPIGVVQVLSRNGVASVGLVKQWLMRRIGESKSEIESTAEKLKDIAELSDADVPKVFHVTQCAAGDGPLELPAVHFMCKHSYHQRCLGEHETECPICATQHGVIRQLRRDNERVAQQHDVFLADVEENGFSAIATAFNRGILNYARVEDGLPA